MKQLGDALNAFFAREGGSDSVAAKARRAAVVRDRWASAVRAVYVTDEAVDFVLSHVNAVYIVDDQLIVYSDDSMVRSDLDARQEFLKLALNAQGESVFSRFKILPSKFNMKARHPFATCSKKPDLRGNNPDQPLRFDPARAESMVEGVADEKVRQALKRAIVADLNK